MDYKEILKSINWPKEVLIIDFETFFSQDYSLSKLSTINYICDSRFDFTGCGFCMLNVPYIEDMQTRNNEPYFIIKPKLEYYIKELQFIFGQRFEKCTVVAKNCKYDLTILAVKFGIIPPFIIDIDDLLRHYDARMSHRMKDVTKMFGLQPKGDTNQFKGLKYGDMSNAQTEALAAYCKKDVQIEVDLFRSLLPQLSNPTVEIPIARHTLGLYLSPSFTFDFKKAEKLKVDMQLVLSEIIETTGFTKKQLGSNLDFVKILQDALPKNETVPTKPGKPGKNMTKLLGMPGVIPAFAKDDVEFQNLLIHPDKKVNSLCKARQAVKSWPLHVKRIDNMANQANASGGLLRVPLNYYGCHTGRFSGGEKINLQNLGGRGRMGSGIHPLIGKMRSLLSTPDGMTLGIADSAQIEARILSWLAGQNDLTEGFANGQDVYSTFATELFQSYVYKALEDDPAPVKHMLKIKRGFGKDTILGAGFGMGANKFHQRCLANEDLRPLFESGEYNFAFIDRLIKTYRKKYAKIPEFWQSVEKAFRWVIKYPHEVCSYGGTVNTHVSTSGRKWFTFPEGTSCPKLIFFNDNGTVHLKLPSGRELTYRHCKLAVDGGYSTIQWHWGHLYGALIVENIVQSCARDLLAWWILEMEKRNLSVVLHSHDEIICALQEKQSEKGLQQMVNIMCSGPDWAAGLPLDAEGCLGKVYKK